MFSKIYDILALILGESKQGGYINGCVQYQWNCPSCAEEKGGVDNKYNLETSFSLGKFHCWACDAKGSLSYLISKYGNSALLNDYKNEIASIKESKLYDLSTFYDLNENVKLNNDLMLPKTATKININELKNKKLKNYLEKRHITQDIIDKFNIHYTLWDNEEFSMRNRIVIPSYNSEKQMNYWVSRDFTGYDKRIKYKNCKADKKEIVFQESLINYDADIVLVEGAFDMLYYPNTIAMLGKFLVKNSELYRKLYTKANANIIICLDGDTTIEETKRIYKLLNVGRLRGKIKFIELNEFKDFGEIYENKGKKGLIETIKEAHTFSEIDLLF